MWSNDDWTIDPATFIPQWDQGPPPFPEPSPELLAALRQLELDRVRLATAYLNRLTDDDVTQHGRPHNGQPRGPRP